MPRIAFGDRPEPERKRHLFRLWLSIDGARPLPAALAARTRGEAEYALRHISTDQDFANAIPDKNVIIYDVMRR